MYTYTVANLCQWRFGITAHINALLTDCKYPVIRENLLRSLVGVGTKFQMPILPRESMQSTYESRVWWTETQHVPHNIENIWEDIEHGHQDGKLPPTTTGCIHSQSLEHYPIECTPYQQVPSLRIVLRLACNNGIMQHNQDSIGVYNFWAAMCDSCSDSISSDWWFRPTSADKKKWFLWWA